MGAAEQNFTMNSVLKRVATREPLNHEEMRSTMALLLSGKASDIEIAGLLMAFNMRELTAVELASAVEAMQEFAVPVDAPEGAVDTCGTGGDGANTFNISTAVALVVAGAGIPVAKHGSTASSSLSGSAEVLRELGVNLNASPDVITQSIREAGVGFMFAAVHHSAVKNVMAARRGLAVRTFFNVIGPLSNPARTKRQLMGVYDPVLLKPAAEAMNLLGVRKAWVVHGADGLDELSTTGMNKIAVLQDGAVSLRSLGPEDTGLPVASINDLRGGNPAQNAAAIRDLLNGTVGPFRDIVCLNAAAAILIAGQATDLKHGLEKAHNSIDSGNATNALTRMISVTNA